MGKVPEILGHAYKSGTSTPYFSARVVNYLNLTCGTIHETFFLFDKHLTGLAGKLFRVSRNIILVVYFSIRT